MAAVAVHCSNCGFRNEIVGIDIPESQIITCSNCEAVIGRWDELLRRQSANDDGETDAVKPA